MRTYRDSLRYQYDNALSMPRDSDMARSEVVLVNAPSGDYVFAITTKNQQDTSFREDNEGHVLIRALSALLGRAFEPKHPFTPHPGAKRLKPPDDP